MKRILSVLLSVSVLVVLLSVLTGTASATTYSDTAFASMAYYNGTYVAGTPGYVSLSYASAASPSTDDAVVGVMGPLGTLSSLNMSFAYSNLVGTSGTPFAAFGVSVDGNWAGSAYRYDVISLQGNQLTGSTLVHVWDWNLNGGAGGNVPGLNNVTLNYVLSQSGYNGMNFGDMQVMRAYAYIGDTGSPSYGSVDINSITVNPVPAPATLLLFAPSLAGLVAMRKRFKK